MSWQEAFNVAFAALAFLGGWFVKTIWQEVKDVDASSKAANTALTEKVAAIELLVAGSYLTRAEYRDDLQKITEALLRIEEKLDSKQDKDSRR